MSSQDPIADAFTVYRAQCRRMYRQEAALIVGAAVLLVFVVKVAQYIEAASR